MDAARALLRVRIQTLAKPLAVSLFKYFSLLKVVVGAIKARGNYCILLR